MNVLLIMHRAAGSIAAPVVAALDLIKACPIKACPSITLMLNKIRLTTSYTFGAYHYFGTYS